MKEKTIDELLGILQWVVDRQRYRWECGIRDGSGHAADAKAESDALAELSRRGYFFGGEVILNDPAVDPCFSVGRPR